MLEELTGTHERAARPLRTNSPHRSGERGTQVGIARRIRPQSRGCTCGRVQGGDSGRTSIWIDHLRAKTRSGGVACPGTGGDA